MKQNRNVVPRWDFNDSHETFCEAPGAPIWPQAEALKWDRSMWIFRWKIGSYISTRRTATTAGASDNSDGDDGPWRRGAVPAG